MRRIFKGTVSRNFCFWFISWISFPPAPEYSIKTVSNFIFASQGAPPVSTTPPVSTAPVANFSTIFASVVDTGGKFTTGVNDTGGKFATGGKQWEQVLNCWQLKMNFKKKCIYANATTQRCPKEIINIFLIEDFFHLSPVSLTPVANLELRISPRIFEKIWNGPNGIIRGLGDTDSWRKKPEAKNLMTLSF